MLITSERKFGVEIEFKTETGEGMKRLSRLIPLTGDGSIRHIKNTAEFVSPVLQGQKGERYLHNICDTLKQHGATGDNPAFSVHIHLDARLDEGKVVKLGSRPKDIPSYGISRKVQKEHGKEVIESYVRCLPTIINAELSQLENVLYLSKAPLSRHPMANYDYFYYEKSDRSKWLRNMLYFYTQYSDVMEGIVSNSRKFGNMYCIPLGKSYDLGEIEGAKDMKQLRSLWYKGRGSSGHYDDSRYHNVNFHSVWNRTGTVEIRSHGGTIDVYKILFWLRLHQHIADKLEEVELGDIKLKGDLYKSFVDFLDDEQLTEYVKRLLGYYSGITIK